MTAQVEGTVSTDVDDTVISVTFAHTVPVMTDGMLLVTTAFNNRTDFNVVSTVTYNGVALTFVGQVTEDDDTRVEMWRLLAPPVGTFNVVITLDQVLGTDQGIVSGAVNYSGVDQTVPIGNIATASSSGSGTATVNIASSVGELIQDGVGSEDTGGPFTVGAGQTQLWNLSSPVAGARQEHGAASTEPGAATVTMSWTLNATDRWGIIAVELLSAATPVPPVVDAGGPYNGDVNTATALNATVTPGTDPTPVLTWTIDSGPGGGTFLPSANVDTVGAYVLKLEANPSDGPPVSDTANFESDDIPPTVEAGGPYTGDWNTATALNATVTPGSDPAPVLLWTIESDPPFPGSGIFSNDAIEDPTFTPFNVGSYVLRLTVTPSDGPAVFDDANFEADPVPPTVDAGGPYTGDPGAQTQLDGTVTVGSTNEITTLWTIDSGGTGSFSDDTVLDPLFTPDDVGPYVLRLTATALDGPTPFDTATFSAAALADAQILNGRLIRGGTQELVLTQLALGADPPAGTVFVEGTAQAGSGEMYVAIDDGVVPRVFIAGIAHQHNGVRLVTFNTPQFFVSGWGIDGNGAQCVGGTGTGHSNEGIKVTNDGFTVVDGVTPIPPTPTAFPQPSRVIHDFDFGDQSQMLAGGAFNFPIQDGGGITRILNKGTDGTSLDYSGVSTEAPTWIQDPTGLPAGSGAARFEITKNTELFKNIVSDPGGNLSVAMIFKGMEEPNPGMNQMFWGTTGPQNALGMNYRAPPNNVGSALLYGQSMQAEPPPATALISYNWYMVVGSVDTAFNFYAQKTGSIPFTVTGISGNGPGPNKIFRLGDRDDAARQFGGDIARVWVWDTKLTLAEGQQMLDWGDENYGPFSYNGIPTLPPIQNDILDTVGVPLSGTDDIEGFAPDKLFVTSNWDVFGVFAGDTIEQNTTFSPNVDMTGKFLVEKVTSDLQFHDTVIVSPHSISAFGPYIGIAFPPPTNFALDILYDSTADLGLLALQLTLNWFSTLIQLPTDGVSNWESYGVVPGDILRFENSLNHGPLDIRVRGFQGSQGGGGKDIQIPAGSIPGLPYLGADISDVRLIKRATK